MNLRQLNPSNSLFGRIVTWLVDLRRNISLHTGPKHACTGQLYFGWRDHYRRYPHRYVPDITSHFDCWRTRFWFIVANIMRANRGMLVCLSDKIPPPTI